jgi:hypothetical protein
VGWLVGELGRTGFTQVLPQSITQVEPELQCYILLLFLGRAGSALLSRTVLRNSLRCRAQRSCLLPLSGRS